MKEGHFLGSGNDGFVASVDRTPGSYVCVKYVWDKLDVVLGPEMTEDDLDPEIRKLRKIARYFENVRQTNQRVTADTNRSIIVPNDAFTEAMIQDISRRVLEEAGVNCFVPRVLEVDSFVETEEMERDEHGNPEPYSYELHDSYSTIAMEQVQGKSLQDIIMGYPETAEYLEHIDPVALEEGLRGALRALHSSNIKHQDITIRNVMFDLERKCPAIIDFGKASCGRGVSDTSDEFENNLPEVVGHIAAFLRDPEKKKAELEAEFAKQAKRLNI